MTPDVMPVIEGPPTTPRGRLRRSLLVAAACIAVLLVALVVRPTVRAAWSGTGEFEHEGVHTIVAGRSDDTLSLYGLVARSARVVIDENGCVLLDDLQGAKGWEEKRVVVSWPPGTRLVGPPGDVHIRLANETRIRPGDEITFGGEAGFDPGHYPHLPEPCRAMDGIHLQTTIGSIEVL